MHAMSPQLFNVCLALLCAIMFAPGSLQQQHGSQIAPCIWQHINGSVININSVGSTNGTARWVDKETVDPETDPNVYSANPCYAFSQTSVCQDVVACKTTLLDVSFNIGDVGSSNMFYSSANKAVILEYSHHDQISDVTKVSQFVLACTGDEAGDQLSVYGSKASPVGTVTYLFYLFSPCACYDGCPNATGPTLGPAPSPTVSMRPIATPTVTMIPIATTGPTIRPFPPASKTISPGGIICIIFVCTIGGYFLIGAAYMFCCAGARGKEIIPNVDFWMTFCSLILEGCEFLCSCCSSAPRNPPLSSQEQTTTEYDKI